MTKPAKKERIYLRIGKGCLTPADAYAEGQLRAKGYKIGDVVAASITKLRSTGFNRLVHRIGGLVVENIEEFHGLDSHACIKRLQWEGNIECDEVGVSMRSAWVQISTAILAMPGMSTIEPALLVVGSMLPGKALIYMRQPRSLSFDQMGEIEYQAAALAICRHISKVYWPTLTAEKIEQMAESFVTD